MVKVWSAGIKPQTRNSILVLLLRMVQKSLFSGSVPYLYYGKNDVTQLGRSDNVVCIKGPVYFKVFECTHQAVKYLNIFSNICAYVLGICVCINTCVTINISHIVKWSFFSETK